MSLLYECINGIIQGGILDSNDDSAGEEEIATLCVNKLRGMIMVEGDPNREYILRDLILQFAKMHSKIRCTTGTQQDCCDAPAPSHSTRGRHIGMY